MLVTRKADYAIRSLLVLARAPDEPMSASEIGEKGQIPEFFVGKILHTLARAGLVDSERGARGGYRLARPAESIHLLGILEAIQGEPVINTCAVASDRCSLSQGCPVHPVWVDLRREVEARLRVMDLATLARTHPVPAPPHPERS